MTFNKCNSATVDGKFNVVCPFPTRIHTILLAVLIKLWSVLCNNFWERPVLYIVSCCVRHYIVCNVITKVTTVYRWNFSSDYKLIMALDDFIAPLLLTS